MESKLYAVRKPEEAKGVYTTAAEMKKVRKKYPSGLSVKEFKPEEVEAARAWAGVKGTVGTPMTTVKEKASETKPNQTIDLTSIEKLLTKLTSESKTESFKQVLQSYQKKGYRHLKLTLNTGETLFITIKDEVYLCDKNQTIQSFENIDLSDFRKDTHWSSSLYDYRSIILASLKVATKANLEPVKDALKYGLFKVLKATEIDYSNDFITLKGFNKTQTDILTSKDERLLDIGSYDLKSRYMDNNNRTPDRFYTRVYLEKFQHADQMKTVSIDAIISIEPYSLGLEERYLDIPGLPDLIRKASTEL